MTQEIGGLPGLAQIATSTFGTLYAVPRSVAVSAKPLGATALPFDPYAYSDASVKVQAAAKLGKGVGLTSKEIRSYYAGLAAMQTFVRHGAKLPWVPDKWADVRAARAVQGATKDALPDPKSG